MRKVVAFQIQKHKTINEIYTTDTFILQYVH